MESYKNIEHRKKLTADTVSPPRIDSNYANLTQLEWFQSSPIIFVQHALAESQTHTP